MRSGGGIISNVKPNSIANELNIVAGDTLLEINGERVRDVIDYQFMTALDLIEIKIQHQDGSLEIYEIEKDFDDDLGIDFEYGVFDQVKVCNNKCLFCFIDQQPKGLRDSLYLKDDDYRLSYLHGNYITLTNLTKADRERIEKLRLGPFYVSVHATNPEARQKLLKNPKSGNIIEELNWLWSLEIPVHAQIVLCPEYNDGLIFDQTLEDLFKIKTVSSVAVVPFGNTRFREQNDIRQVTQKDSLQILQQCEAFNKKYKTRFVFPSDEFYLLSGQKFPSYSTYNNFPQLDDGVGTARFFQESFITIEHTLPTHIPRQKSFALITGKLGEPVLQPVVKRLNQIHNLQIEILVLESEFWGKEITVSGLIVGMDILNAFKNSKKIYHKVIIPAVMLRKGTDQFLDGLTVSELQNKLDLKIDIIYDYYHANALVESVLNESLVEKDTPYAHNPAG